MQQFPTATTRVLRKACRAAHRAMDKPPDRMTIKDAAWQVMQGAYEAACGGVGLANARQIMYRARPLILEMTGQEKKFNDKYFTQTLLPDFIGHASVAFSGGWTVHRIPILRKRDGGLGVGTASIPVLDAEGRVKMRDSKRMYAAVITFDTAAARERWQQSVLSALNAGDIGDAPELPI
jgi:hypothetical protein